MHEFRAELLDIYRDERHAEILRNIVDSAKYEPNRKEKCASAELIKAIYLTTRDTLHISHDFPPYSVTGNNVNGLTLIELKWTVNRYLDMAKDNTVLTKHETVTNSDERLDYIEAFLIRKFGVEYEPYAAFMKRQNKIPESIGAVINSCTDAEVLRYARHNRPTVSRQNSNTWKIDPQSREQRAASEEKSRMTRAIRNEIQSGPVCAVEGHKESSVSELASDLREIKGLLRRLSTAGVTPTK